MIPYIKDQRLFITGGAGFIGSAIVERLIDDNQIAVYDSFRRNALTSRPVAKHPHLTIITGDVLDYQDLARAIVEFEPTIIVHCAAIAGIDTVVKKPTETLRINLLGTAHVLEAARNLQHVDRLICFSTSEVFGRTAFQVDEVCDAHIGAVGEARWTYAVSKLAGEHLARAYYDEFGIPTVTVRPFNVYGPGQVGDSAMKTFIHRALLNQPLEIHGDGNQIRAWCYIDDFLDGLLLTMVHPNAVGESFNIGNPRSVITVYGLAQTVVRVLGSTSPVRFVNRKLADVELRVPNTKKATEKLGFVARVDLEEGIANTAAFLKRHL